MGLQKTDLPVGLQFIIALQVLAGLGMLSLIMLTGFVPEVIGGGIILLAIAYGLSKKRNEARWALIVVYGVLLGLQIFGIFKTSIGLVDMSTWVRMIIEVVVIIYLLSNPMKKVFTKNTDTGN